MNIQHIFSEIEKTDPEIFERLDSRRHIMHRFKNIGSRLALTAIPVALGSMLNKAYGQVPPDIIGILNFALKLEYLEAYFYTTGLGTTLSTGSLIAPEYRASFELIKKHELAHIVFLKATIGASGGIPIDEPEFDLKLPPEPNGNTHPDPFSGFLPFLTRAQVFEDLGVRTYKGQLRGLISNNELVTAVLKIQSVEARHAAYARKLRRKPDIAPKCKPWITGFSNNGIDENWVRDTYEGEDDVVQLGVELVRYGIFPRAATESFDEPLYTREASEIINLFG